MFSRRFFTVALVITLQSFVPLANGSQATLTSACHELWQRTTKFTHRHKDFILAPPFLFALHKDNRTSYLVGTDRSHDGVIALVSGDILERVAQAPVLVYDEDPVITHVSAITNKVNVIGAAPEWPEKSVPLVDQLANSDRQLFQDLHERFSRLGLTIAEPLAMLTEQEAPFLMGEFNLALLHAPFEEALAYAPRALQAAQQKRLGNQRRARRCFLSTPGVPQAVNELHKAIEVRIFVENQSYEIPFDSPTSPFDTRHVILAAAYDRAKALDSQDERDHGWRYRNSRSHFLDLLRHYPQPQDIASKVNINWFEQGPTDITALAQWQNLAAAMAPEYVDVVVRPTMHRWVETLRCLHNEHQGAVMMIEKANLAGDVGLLAELQRAGFVVEELSVVTLYKPESQD